ncbi:MAG: class I SAM-dependent methyltransferase [Candidatus Acidiferrales bacterium]
MNLVHRWFCRSDRWRKMLDSQLFPWTLADVDLGSETLEIGPGPGLTTDLLRRRFSRVTSLEIDPRMASSLRMRLAGSNVEVVEGDATAMPFPDATFPSIVSFVMLHHVPTPALQDRLFREAFRVLRPGSVFLSMDFRSSWWMSLAHIGDTMVTLDPRTVPARLEAAGFSNVIVDLGPRGGFRFRAYRD